jgi:hypothetical protein
MSRSRILLFFILAGAVALALLPMVAFGQSAPAAGSIAVQVKNDGAGTHLILRQPDGTAFGSIAFEPYSDP